MKYLQTQKNKLKTFKFPNTLLFFFVLEHIGELFMKCSQTTPKYLRKAVYPCMLLDVIYFALCQEKVNLKRLCCRPTL